MHVLCRTACLKVDVYADVLNLHSEAGGYGTWVVRSRNLMTWESSHANPILDFKGSVEADKGSPPRSKSPLYFTNFTAPMEAFITNATGINNSDIDFVDAPDGETCTSRTRGATNGAPSSWARPWCAAPRPPGVCRPTSEQ